MSEPINRALLAKAMRTERITMGCELEAERLADAYNALADEAAQPKVPKWYANVEYGDALAELARFRVLLTACLTARGRGWAGRNVYIGGSIEAAVAALMQDGAP